MPGKRSGGPARRASQRGRYPDSGWNADPPPSWPGERAAVIVGTRACSARSGSPPQRGTSLVAATLTLVRHPIMTLEGRTRGGPAMCCPSTVPQALASPAMAAEPDELRAAVEQLNWYHRMELPGGVITPGVSETTRALPRLRLPERLDGLTVLDIGAWDGFYSFEAKRRGAARVLATDSYSWAGEGWGTKEGFLLARDALGVDVEDLDVDVMDLSAARVGRFDIVLLLGVLYHLRDPVTALERAAEVTAGRLILETETSLAWYRWPAAAIYPGRDLNDDDTNWWALNPAALRGLLLRVGFRRVETVWRTSLPRRAARAAVLRGRTGQPARQQFRSQRIVMHAWKGEGHPGPG